MIPVRCEKLIASLTALSLLSILVAAAPAPVPALLITARDNGLSPPQVDGGSAPVESILTRVITDGSPTTSQTSLRILYQNNLNPSTSSSHISGFLSGPVTSSQGSSVCSSLSESPMPFDQLTAHSDDFLAQFSYLCHVGTLSCPTHVWVEDGVITVQENGSAFTKQPTSSFSGKSLPQLCTQSDTQVLDSSSAPSSTNKITVQDSNSNSYTGYHNKQAFRFLGIPYANNPGRFEYSAATTARYQAVDATQYQAECTQDGSAKSTEECLYLNIHTPYLPAAGSSSSSSSGLRPVVVYIHGGAFVSGSGSGSSISGDNMASREDVVMVSINYRLNTYGFMAISGSSLAGNYGISDMVAALDWVAANIAHFGGDPAQITVAGQSAGAAAVRILLGSPKAIGKFQRAIVMSNLGGGVDLGLQADFGSSNSQYYTIEQSYALAGQRVLDETDCNLPSSTAQAACLKAYTGDLADLSTTSRFVVQDGVYVTSPRLEVGRKSSAIAAVPLLMGNLLDDGASFVGYSRSCSSLQACLQANLAISASTAQGLIASGLFPAPNTGNPALDAFNVSQRVYTDNTFRCIDQATAYAAATSGSTGPVYYYQGTRTYGGFNPNGVDATGPKSSAFPLGDPDLPYFRLHSGELAFAFGNAADFRDAADYGFVQLMTAYWGAFVRSGNPNPDLAWLRARGYADVVHAVQGSGAWPSVQGKQGPMMRLDWPASVLAGFEEGSQCDWLNYTLGYYMDS